MTYTPGTQQSEYIYSDYQASLLNSAEIDTGWMDMAEYDKYQFEGVASAAGMTMVITSSNVSGGGEADVVSTTLTLATFHLFNVIVRQRYMRFQFQNLTGGTLTDVAMSIKGTYGSSDKLSVFPLAQEPTDFSQAALVQAVSKGQQPDGDYVNLPADGSAFNTSATLAGAAAYTSAWVDTDGWNSIELFIASDVLSEEQGIEVEYTDDVQAGTPTVRATSRFSFKQADVDRGFLVWNVSPVLDGFRVRYTNGASVQSSFYLDATLKVYKDNGRVNSAGAAVTADYLTEVALGNVSNYQIGTKFGRNPVVNAASTPEDIWTGGSTYTGHPESFTPETVDVVSTSAADASGGTGARTVEITGLRTSTSTQYTTETISMNGTTVVTSANTWWRVNRLRVLTAGSGGANAGVVSAESTTGGDVFASMGAGFNQTTVAAYTVPAEKTLLMKRVRVSIVRANGSAGSATVSLRTRPPGGVYNAARVFELQTAAPTEFTNLGGDDLEPGTDIKFTVDDVSDNGTVCEAAFEYVLIDR